MYKSFFNPLSEKTERFKTTNGMLSDGRCNALRWPMESIPFILLLGGLSATGKMFLVLAQAFKGITKVDGTA